MKTFTVTFKHKVLITYTTEVEADSLDEVKNLIEENPFMNEVKEIDTEGLDFKIIEVKEIE